MKSYAISHSLDLVDWNQLTDVYGRERQKARPAESLAQAFHNSHLCVFAFHGDQVVGAARAISDGFYYATIVDVVVDGPHQNQGLGRAMMEALIARLPMEKVYLTTVPGKEGFYETLGFSKNEHGYCLRPLDVTQPGSRPRPVIHRA